MLNMLKRVYKAQIKKFCNCNIVYLLTIRSFLHGRSLQKDMLTNCLYADNDDVVHIERNPKQNASCATKARNWT